MTVEFHRVNDGDRTMDSLLKNNTGKIDRTIRIVAGLLLVGNVFIGLVKN